MPFEQVCIDMKTVNGNQYIVMVDRFSGYIWLDICPKRKSKSEHLVDRCLNIFTHTTFPDEIASDDGGEFESTLFQDFIKKYKIRHRMSAPYFPSSNGRAELAIEKVLKLLEEATNEEGWMDSEYIKMSLMTIRNTPDKNGISPSQILFGRPIKDHLPNVNQHGKDIDQH